MSKSAVLFVCLGNICRSPLAEAVFRDVAQARGLRDRFRADSAGTGDWHVGNPPDRRSVAVGAAHGIDLAGLRARQISGEDFARFDYVLGMDDDNVSTLRRLAPAGARAEIDQYHRFATGIARPVPDPYYGGEDGFEQVYRLIRTASEALVEKLADDPAAESG